ncbi:MAG: alanine--tRNA ligase, partial [Calditrichaeota bacterium]
IYHSVVKNPKIIPGNTVFMLYDTYGFPYDLTEVMAEERGYTLDETGFNQAMEEQRKKSRAAATFSADAADAALILLEKFKPLMENLSETIFNRDTLTLETELIFANSTDTDDGALILKESPFYVESGGQVGDIGKIYADSFEFEVHMVMNHQNYYIHLGKFINGNSGDANNDKSVTAEVNADRRWSIMRNHTVTHLTHAALRQVLGPHIKQSGSYVGPDRMRFDFSHHQPMTDEEIERIEQIVNSEILKATDVNTDVMDIENAKKTGAMALFGEKYDDNVRVVSVGTFSKELCGGTHVNNSSQIGPFFITLETGIASGVRRIEAITGEEAIKFMIDAQKNRKEAASIIGRPEPELLEGIQALKEQNSQLQKELKKVKANMFAGAGTSVGNEEEINGLIFYTHFFGETDRDTMASWIDSKKEANDPVVAVALGLVDDKMTYVGAASKAATESRIHIGNLTKELLAQFGGRGGGKPNFAQGSVDNESKPEELFETAKNIIAKDA